MSDILHGAGGMFVIIVVACFIVFVAMILDLVSGIRKAKQRGEARTSYGLSRTITKFISYEGGMLIAAGIDILMYMSNLVLALGLKLLHGVPVITCLMGVFLLVVEAISLYEKADEKTRKRELQAAELVKHIVSKDDLKEMLREVLEHNKKVEGEQ